MNHSTGTPTKAQKQRFLDLFEMGCIVCLLHYHIVEPPQIHHLLSGGRRIGHDATIPLCPWHHVGQAPAWQTVAIMRRYRGPSLALDKRGFVRAFGTEDSLLEIVNGKLALPAHLRHVPQEMCSEF